MCIVYQIRAAIITICVTLVPQPKYGNRKHGALELNLELNGTKFCPNLLNGGIHKDRAPAKQSLLQWPCHLPSDDWSHNLFSMTEFRVKCVTYAHS